MRAVTRLGAPITIDGGVSRSPYFAQFLADCLDTEIIVQLIAHSKQSMLVDCIADSLAQVDGAFSIVMMTRNR